MVLTTVSWARVPNGFRDIRLGMPKTQVIKILKKSAMHFSYEDMGEQVGEIVRGNKMFRYATYRFDSGGRLVEIGLQMREIMGTDKVLELFNSRHGLKLSPAKSSVQDDLIIEVRGNSLIMRGISSKGTRSAEAVH